VTTKADRPLEGRPAVVTGAGRRIGRAIALGLVGEGACVALLARSEDQLAEVAERVKELGGIAVVVPTDIGDRAAVERGAARVLEELGTVEILINNAGVVAPLGATSTLAIDEWAAAIEVNVIGVVNLTLALVPKMLDQSWGRIVNVSSGAGAQPGGMIGGNAYVTSKAALEAHTLNLAAELEGTGVTVNAYRPGGVDTAMQGWIRRQPPERIGAALHQRFVESYESGTLITPEQSAASLLRRIPSDATGEIWSARDA
jgi:NAD(P)-dependent dehydrogenase (short-subunit alcohol dehydrogenase family)